MKIIYIAAFMAASFIFGIITGIHHDPGRTESEITVEPELKSVPRELIIFHGFPDPIQCPVIISVVPASDGTSRLIISNPVGGWHTEPGRGWLTDSNRKPETAIIMDPASISATSGIIMPDGTVRQ